MKKYSFNLRAPDTSENRFIEVGAKNKTDAKELILKELSKVNKQFIEVFVLTKKKRKELDKEVYCKECKRLH